MAEHKDRCVANVLLMCEDIFSSGNVAEHLTAEVTFAQVCVCVCVLCVLCVCVCARACSPQVTWLKPHQRSPLPRRLCVREYAHIHYIYSMYVYLYDVYICVCLCVSVCVCVCLCVSVCVRDQYIKGTFLLSNNILCMCVTFAQGMLRATPGRAFFPFSHRKKKLC